MSDAESSSIPAPLLSMSENSDVEIDENDDSQLKYVYGYLVT